MNLDSTTNSSYSKHLVQKEELGNGGFATVYRGESLGQDVAIKVLHNVTKEAVQGLAREMKILQENPHPRIVQVFEYFCKPPSYKIIMEFMPRGSLDKLLRSEEKLSWFTRLRILQDIVSGMAFLHFNDIVHCDLKSSNILLDENLRAKISDFGMSRMKNENSTFGNGFQIGTYRYMAPELMEEDSKITKASDVYSLGVIAWETGARAQPLEGLNLAGIAKKVTEEEIREPIDPSTPEAISQLIVQCWKRDPKERPTMEQVAEVLKNNPIEKDADEAEPVEDVPEKEIPPTTQSLEPGHEIQDSWRERARKRLHPFIHTQSQDNKRSLLQLKVGSLKISPLCFIENRINNNN